MSEEKHYLSNGAETATAPAEALEWTRSTQAKMVDLKFTDLLGSWQHMTLPLSAFDESAFEDGLGFDGSSIRGWQGISESDMLLVPQAETAILDPATEEPTMSIICEVIDPVTREPYPKDPRRLARRAEEYLRSTGIADTAYFGPESEFFVFDTVAYDMSVNYAHYEVDSDEGHWNSGLPGLGYTLRPKEGYFPPAPHDTLHDLRTEMVLTLERLGIPCEFHHHEVATGGQCEIDMRFGTLTRMADQVMTYKYVVKNVARRHGKTVTFMPKPLFGDNGSGMHTHQSLWKERRHADGGSVGLCRALEARPELRRRPARARSGAARVLRPDDELVPPARAGVRGAGQPRLLAAESLSLYPHPDVLRVAEGEADRVPLPRPDRQPVPRLLGDADGGDRRDRARARPGRSGGLRPLRGVARARWRRCRARSRPRSRRWRRTTPS